MEQLSDETLMLKYGKGDAKAFEVLYGRHKEALYRFVRRQCRDPETAYDLVHDIWIKLIKARRRYHPAARFTTYLFTLARNRMIDFHRARVARPGTTLPADNPVDVETMPDDDDQGPAMRAHIRDVLERSMESVYGLPPLQREAVLMYVEGFSMAEIGEITQVPAESARSCVRRALAKLRPELKGLA